MSGIEATIVGNVVADPEAKQVGALTVYEFPVYVNHDKKNKDTGSYDKTGDVSKVRVSVWREHPGVAKGDLVEVKCGLVEKTFTKRDGTEGRQLQTEWVESVNVKSSSNWTAAGNVVQTLGGRELAAEDVPF